MASVPTVEIDRSVLHRARSVSSFLVAAFALVALLLSSVAVWAQSTLFNSQKVVSIASASFKEPEVQDGLAAYLTDQTMSLLDVNNLVSRELPSELVPIVPMLVGGVESQVQGQVSKLLASAEAQKILASAVLQAHQAAMKLLRGGGVVDGVTIKDGSIKLNVFPLVSQILVWAQQQFGVFKNAEIRTLPTGGNPDAQRRELEAALGITIPVHVGQLTIYQSKRVDHAQASLAIAQRMVVAAKRATWAALVATTVLMAASVALAMSRQRAVLFLGLGSLSVFVLTRSALNRVIDEAPSLVSGAAQRVAVLTTVTAAVSGLLKLLAVLMAMSAVIAVVSLVRSDNTRRAIAMVTGVVMGLALVNLVGLSIVSLIVGIVVGIAVGVGVEKAFPVPTRTAS